ncbi:MAG: sensor histidine kinase [Desulfuromonas sp.]|nr:MAG: sensor histidine kinase [Desulfuromonas sp.]
MPKSTPQRIVILLLLVVGITALHYLTTIQKDYFHDIYRRLYYLPVVLGGLWFGFRGGLLTALAVSVIYAPHVLFQWGHHPSAELEQYLEIMLYNIIGCLTGLLAERQRVEIRRHQATAQRLEESYQHLKEQADQILEIAEQLRRADRLTVLGELSAGMAHEIRNPLGSIRGTAEILRDGVPQDDPKAEFAEILLKEVDRLNRVVQEFLDFARPGQADMFKRTEICALLHESVQLIGNQARKGRVDITLRCDTLPAFMGDAEKIKQALLNLLLNALQAMPDGGALRIEADSGEKELRVRISDSGCGIPAEAREKIFNPFYTTRAAGTGLGLAITHRIIQSHGGRLEVESSVGVGTTFTMLVPLAGNGGEGG